MIKNLNINEIINNSKLIKDDHVKVYNYKNKYLIKKKYYNEENLNIFNYEKKILSHAISAGILINELLDNIVEDRYMYVFYKFVNSEGDFDYVRLGENYRKLHELKDIDLQIKSDYDYSLFDKSIEIGKSFLTKHELKKWNEIGCKAIENYKIAEKNSKNKSILHGDIDFGNMIAPSTIIDTEEIYYGAVENDICCFYRMGYRYGEFDLMNDLLKGYSYDGDFDKIKDFFNFKDFKGTCWLIRNHKSDINRINDIKQRMQNWENWNYTWILYK